MDIVTEKKKNIYIAFGFGGDVMAYCENMSELRTP